ncbi:hypothetical protein ACU21_06135 [Actinobaculum suis]|nr:hypothetical protein ACU21_06135 [Actinobaculum suis]
MAFYEVAGEVLEMLQYPPPEDLRPDLFPLVRHFAHHSPGLKMAAKLYWYWTYLSQSRREHVEEREG